VNTRGNGWGDYSLRDPAEYRHYNPVPMSVAMMIAELRLTQAGEFFLWSDEASFTVERAESIYRSQKEQLASLAGVKLLYGDSRKVLPSVVAEIGARKAVFWLDGHWSGAETAGADDECPLMGELACLSGRTGDIVLIDDARLFLCAPPQPHKASEWPTISDVVEALSRLHSRPFVQVIDDVIFAIPDEASEP